MIVSLSRMCGRPDTRLRPACAGLQVPLGRCGMACASMKRLGPVNLGSGWRLKSSVEDSSKRWACSIPECALACPPARACVLCHRSHPPSWVFGRCRARHGRRIAPIRCTRVRDTTVQASGQPRRRGVRSAPSMQQRTVLTGALVRAAGAKWERESEKGGEVHQTGEARKCDKAPGFHRRRVV